MLGRYNILLDRVEKEIPGVKVILHKDSWLMKVIHFLLKVLTFGKFEPNRFTTTIGKRMYVPNDWHFVSDQSKYVTLRHELIHMRQFRRWPFKFLDLPVLRLINFLLFSFCYIFVMIPTVWSMRAKFEREAYTQTLLTHYEIMGKWHLSVIGRLVSNMGKYFGGSDYFYMWDKKKAMKWAAQTMSDIEDGLITNDRDRVGLD